MKANLHIPKRLSPYAAITGMLLLLVTSCAKGPETFTGLNIGQEHQGGIIFYLTDATKQHGLIAAKSGWNGTADDPKSTWGCSGTTITGADGQNVGTGAQNTQDIVTAGCNGAGKNCANLTLNGFSDWFLPSVEELKLIMQFNGSVDLGLKPGVLYFSSSENGTGANTISSDEPYTQENSDKAEEHHFRPVRSF
ncbi:MAG: hypothetical protein IPM95_05210 [Sphingobacteriales bacterium]|jgi:hypothetical protein|nr:hypothetical protein [Sphingobacteriales bacterium]